MGWPAGILIARVLGVGTSSVWVGIAQVHAGHAGCGVAMRSDWLGGRASNKTGAFCFAASGFIDAQCRLTFNLSYLVSSRSFIAYSSLFSFQKFHGWARAGTFGFCSCRIYLLFVLVWSIYFSRALPTCLDRVMFRSEVVSTVCSSVMVEADAEVGKRFRQPRCWRGYKGTSLTSVHCLRSVFPTRCHVRKK